MTIFDDYVEYTNKYKAQYGDKTLVLIEVGSFWELYNVDDLNNMKYIGSLLQIHVTRKNKNIKEITTSNPEMAGFPSHSLEKFLPILLDDDYTVVLVGQVTPPPNPKRQVTQILSKGTMIDNVTQQSNNIMAMHIDKGKTTTCIGMAIVDLSTGFTRVFETYSKPDDQRHPYDEAHRFISTYSPVELTITGDSTQVDKYLTLNMRVFKIAFENVINKEITNPTYQNALLAKVFTDTGIMTPVEFINLEMYQHALVAFVAIIRYAYNHDETLIKKLKKPELDETSKQLIVSYNALDQLDINGLIKIINRCATAMGRRYFNHRIKNPSACPLFLEDSYARIASLQNEGDVRKHHSDMRQVYDVERIFRRCEICKVSQFEIVQLLSSLKIIPCTIIQKQSQDLVEFLESTMSDDVAFFWRGVYPELDEINDQKLEIDTALSAFVDDINNLCNNVFKLENNDRDGLHLICTSKRYNVVKTSHSNTPLKFMDTTLKIGEFKEKAKGSESNQVKITHPLFQKATMDLIANQHKKQSIFNETFSLFVSDFCNRFDHVFDDIIKSVCRYDFYLTCALNAMDMKYVQPKISQGSQGSQGKDSSPFIIAKDMRHPIVERIHDSIEYIANDIDIGTPESKGWLLYGLNAAGKSTCMKAIAINLIMAQSGMFVPCSSFEYKPYQHVFSRISQGDNLYKGQSTFVVEMLELRNILTRCDRNSLVIGDELCSGTESASAVAIVAAGIITLVKQEATFIFATHLHDLTSISDVKNLQGIKVCHLHVEYDNINKMLIYDRKIKDGQGLTTYGIEVCKSLDLCPSFLDLAHKIRREHTNINDSVLDLHKSRYNAKVLVDTCTMCGLSGLSGLSHQNLEVHHIRQQKDADALGFIGDIHKNTKSNLAVLCQSCHDKVHHGRDDRSQPIVVKGYRQTSRGVRLIYT